MGLLYRPWHPVSADVRIYRLVPLLRKMNNSTGALDSHSTVSNWQSSTRSCGGKTPPFYDTESESRYRITWVLIRNRNSSKLARGRPAAPVLSATGRFVTIMPGMGSFWFDFDRRAAFRAEAIVEAIASDRRAVQESRLVVRCHAS